MYGDLLLTVTVFLFLVTTVVAIIYYWRIKRVNEEYQKAREVVGDIVISFNRQLHEQENRLSVIVRKNEAVFSKAENMEKKTKKHDKQLADLIARVEGLLGIENKVSTHINRMNKGYEAVLATQEKMMKKIEAMKSVEYNVPATPEAMVEAVIPIKREKALAPLTETELGVLRILASEGGKTAPEIRDKIKLTREHTARLMKKLYETGYLERDTRKIPYTYRIKKEMLKILRRRETIS